MNSTRLLLRSALGLRSSSLARPSPVARGLLAPFYAQTQPSHAIHATSQHVEPTNDPRQVAPNTGAATPPRPTSAAFQPSPSSPVTTPSATTTPSSPSASASVRELLPALAAQPNHYIRAHIHGFPYLVTPGDKVRLPFKMPGVVPGDVLRLTRASVLGSRDFTLKGSPYLDERLFELRAVVTGEEAEPMRVKEKTKRRNRKVRHVYSKHRYTTLRVSELKVKSEVPE